MTHHAPSSENYEFIGEIKNSLEQHIIYTTLQTHLQRFSQSSLTGSVNNLEIPKPFSLNRQDRLASILRRLACLDLPGKEDIEDYQATFMITEGE